MAKLFDERLCEEVRRHPLIYQTTFPDHRDNQKNAVAWRQIAEALAHDEKDCRNRWRNLRDKFVRWHRRGQSQGMMLSWLEEFVAHRRPNRDNSHSPVKTYGQLRTYEPESDTAEPPPPPTTRRVSHSKKKHPRIPPPPSPRSPDTCENHTRPRQTDYQSTTSTSTSCPSKSAHPPSSSPPPSSSSNSKRKEVEDDEDELFGRLLARGLRQLPPETNLELKTEFLGRLKEARLDFMKSKRHTLNGELSPLEDTTQTNGN